MTTVNNDQRREVAKRMREYDVAEFKESAIVPFLECLGYGYTDWRGILDALANSSSHNQSAKTPQMGITRSMRLIIGPGMRQKLAGLIDNRRKHTLQLRRILRLRRSMTQRTRGRFT